MRPPFEFDCSANQLRIANQEIWSVRAEGPTYVNDSRFPRTTSRLCLSSLQRVAVSTVTVHTVSEKLSGRSAPAAALAPSYIIHHEKKKVLPPCTRRRCGCRKKKGSCKFARSCVTTFNTSLHPLHKIFVVYPGFHSNLRPPRSPIQFLYYLLGWRFGYTRKSQRTAVDFASNTPCKSPRLYPSQGPSLWARSRLGSNSSQPLPVTPVSQESFTAILCICSAPPDDD